MKALFALLFLAGCALPSKTEGWCFPKFVRSLMTLMLVSGATFASDLPKDFEERELQAYCKDGMCILKESDLDWMMQSNAELVKRLQEPKKCAKVEITEPPKKLPPIKTERNS